MITRDDSIIFENDAELEAFAIAPTIISHNDENGFWYDWDFTQMFKDACNKGKTIYIEDPNSLILKRQAITYKCITKNVEVEEYYGQFDDSEIMKEIIKTISSDTTSDGRDMSKYSINGKGSFNKTELVIECVKMVVKDLVENKDSSIDEAVDCINEIKIHPQVVSTSKDAFRENRCKPVKMDVDGEDVILYVNNQWSTSNIDVFINGITELLENVDGLSDMNQTIIDITCDEIYADFSEIKRSGDFPYDPIDVQRNRFIYHCEEEDVISMIYEIIKRHLPDDVDVDGVAEIELAECDDYATLEMLDYSIMSAKCFVNPVPDSKYVINFFSDYLDEDEDEY